MRGTLLLLLTVVACTACLPAMRPAAERSGLPAGSGLLYVYLGPWPQDAAGLSVRVAEIAAVGDDGTRYPLATQLSDWDSKSVTRDRLVASGAVPRGRFVALELRAASAAVREDSGPVALQVAQEPARLPVLFSVGERQGTVLAASLDARNTLANIPAFQPVLNVGLVPRPALGVLGLVSSSADGAVVMLDKRSGQVGAVAPVGRDPEGLVIDRDHRRAFVAVAGDDAVATIDLEQASVAERRVLRGGDEPVDVRLTPDGNTLLVVNRGSGSLAFLEPQGLSEIDRIAVGSGPSSVVVDHLGVRAYVCNTRESTVTVVDLASRHVAATIGVDPGPLRAQLDRREERLWVVHEQSPYLTAIDTRTASVAQRLSIGSAATAHRVDLQTGRIYVARRDGTAIDIFDPLSAVPVDTLPMRGSATYLAIDGEGNTLSAAIPSAHAVRAIGLVSRSVAWTADVGAKPVYVSFVGER